MQEAIYPTRNFMIDYLLYVISHIIGDLKKLNETTQDLMLESKIVKS